MLENYDANTPSRDDERKSPVAEYLERADAACGNGDSVLGMHLYLAAFEQSLEDEQLPTEAALFGIKQAWAIACGKKERSIAEYIFEKMSPYLNVDEVDACISQLHDLALDGLETIGISREEIEDMTRAISQSLMGVDARVLKVEHIVQPKNAPGMPGLSGAPIAPIALNLDAGKPAADASGCETPGSSCSCGGCADCGDDSDAVAGDGAAAAGAGAGAGAGKSADAPAMTDREAIGALFEGVGLGLGLGETAPPFTYDNLAGYDSVIAIMRDCGIGMEGDPEYEALIKQLNARHGLDRMPAPDSMLFRSPAREDASRFVAATLGELKRPALRMHMEENLQGMPILCMTTQADNAPQLNKQRNAFVGSGVLVLENLDLWGAPLADAAEGHGQAHAHGHGQAQADPMAARMSHGAREAIALIRSAVENPDVYVLATASTLSEIDGFFLDLLEPLSILDIELPTPEERVDIWMDIAREHPSMRAINRADLVRLSANMPRFDMYMAAREAVEEAYKMGLMARHYRPVTRDIIFDKLAAYQPLDSVEYHELEDAVVRDFRRDIADLENLLAEN